LTNYRLETYDKQASIIQEVNMPLVTVNMWEGRSVEQKKELVQGITSVMTDKLGIPAEAVTIIIKDVPKHNWAIGGKLASE
jgi:4-oxalocrotonate tautomerase